MLFFSPYFLVWGFLILSILYFILFLIQSLILSQNEIIFLILQEEILQIKSAEALAELMYHCVARRPCPNDKLIKNICGLTCMDPSETPQAKFVSSIDSIDDQGLLSFGTSVGKQKSKVNVLTGEDRSKVEGFISRRGSEHSLRLLCEKFGASLFDKLPKLWDCLTEVLKPSSAESLASNEKHVTMAIESVSDPQILINNIQVGFICSNCEHESIHQFFLQGLNCNILNWNGIALASFPLV